MTSNENMTNQNVIAGKALEAPWTIWYENVPANLEYPNTSMAQLVKAVAEKYPSLIALEYFGTKITYKDLWSRIETCANSFLELGVKPGDYVTIAMPNTPEAVVAFYAANLIEAIANMIHPKSSINEVRSAVMLTKSRTIVACNINLDSGTGVLENLDTLLKDEEIHNILENVIVANPNDSMPLPLSIGYEITRGRKIKKVSNEKFTKFTDMMKLGRRKHSEFGVATNGDDVAAIIYSGGTTKEPKGIELTNNNFNALAVGGIAMCDDIVIGDRILAIMPIFHGFGLGICIHSCLSIGGTAIIRPEVNIKEFSGYFKKLKPQIMAGVPKLFVGLMGHPDMEGVDMSSLKMVISGGSALPIATKRKAEAFLAEHNANISVREGYGLTETVTGSCLNPKQRIKEGSIGIPYPDVYYKIVKLDTHEEADINEIGEICICGPTVMKGYLNNPEATTAALQVHPDGRTWLHTGDLGLRDEDAYFKWIQRKDKMLNPSGFSVNPLSIEEVFDSIDEVQVSVAVGVPDERTNQRIRVYLKLKQGATNHDEIVSKAFKLSKENLSYYAYAKEIEIRSELPYTLIGKPNVRELEKEISEGRTDHTAHVYVLTREGYKKR